MSVTHQLNGVDWKVVGHLVSADCLITLLEISKNSPSLSVLCENVRASSNSDLSSRKETLCIQLCYSLGWLRLKMAMRMKVNGQLAWLEDFFCNGWEFKLPDGVALSAAQMFASWVGHEPCVNLVNIKWEIKKKKNSLESKFIFPKKNKKTKKGGDSISFLDNAVYTSLLPFKYS